MDQTCYYCGGEHESVECDEEAACSICGGNHDCRDCDSYSLPPDSQEDSACFFLA